MNPQEGPKTYKVSAEANKKINLAMRKLAKTQAALFDQTVRTYLWRFLPACQGKHKQALVETVKNNGAAFSVVDTLHDKLTSTTTVMVAYARYNPGSVIPAEQKMIQMTFRVTSPLGVGTDNVVLEFGHEEVPFDKQKYGTQRS